MSEKRRRDFFGLTLTIAFIHHKNTNNSFYTTWW